MTEHIFEENSSNNFTAKKSLGQNFLHAPHIIGAMIHAANVAEAVPQGMSVLEVGPGKGVLTEELLAAGAHVIAVEKDDRAIPFLQEKFAGSMMEGKLELFHGDILDFGREESREESAQPANLSGLKKKLIPGKYIVVANIPYYITGELLRMFLESDAQPARMVLMVQKEVADRIVTRGDNGRLDGKESILSISVKAFGQPKYIVTVPAKNFRPAPNVDSAVILIDNITNSFFSQNTNKLAFFRIVKAGFAHKRKVLIGNLSEIIPREALDKVWITCGLDRKVRAEELHVETWGKMLAELTALGVNL